MTILRHSLMAAIPLSWALVVASTAAPVSFAPRVDFATAPFPNFVAIGDVSGDGKPDLATANNSSNSVTVLRGNGAGAFGGRIDLPTGLQPLTVAIGDLNGDGNADLVTANFGSSTVSVLMGEGAGGFGTHTDFVTGDNPASVAIGDVNGDGKLDLVTASRTANTVSVLLGDGTGGFGARSDFAAGLGPAGVAIGDLDADGDSDVAVANRDASTVSVLWGDGTGAFGTRSDFATGVNPWTVAIADVSGDGWPDLIVSNVTSYTVSVRLGVGGGKFGEKTDYSTQTKPYSFDVGDLNGDGRPDLAVANSASSTISVLLGDGAGGFGSQITFPTGTYPQSVAIGDVNGDGRPDLVEPNNSSSSVSVLINTSSGSTFAPQWPASCISLEHACLAVPVRISRNNIAPIRGYSVTLTLSPELVACGAGIFEGSYLSDVGSTHYEVINNGGGSYTVDCVILGLPCGATAPGGTVFTLSLGSSVPTGTGTVTINSVTARDCNNGMVVSFAGAPVGITIDQVAPEAIADLAVVQETSGNDPGMETTNMTLSFSAPGDAAGVEVYRAPFGGTDLLPLGTYPEYTGGMPAAPSYPPTEPWAPTAVTSSGGQDNPGTRGFWYYVAFSLDACGNASAASNVANGRLDYFLGDVANGETDCTGSNRVDLTDITALGAHYGATLSVADLLACLDVGRTTDGSVGARPAPDNHLNFEDLILYAINYEIVSVPQFAASRVSANTDALSLEAPASVAAGQVFTVSLLMQGAGNVQGISSWLRWDHAVAEPLSVAAGELIASQNGVVLSSQPGNVDCALLGSGRGIVGDGVLARMTFRALAAGKPLVALASVDARGTRNQPLAMAGVMLPVPSMTAFAPAMPNPFSRSTSLTMALARAGAVTLAVYGVDGRKVLTLVNDVREAGTYRITWDGRDGAGHALRAGMYYARLSTPEGHFTRTLVLMK